MPRDRQFHEPDALDRATAVFAAHGFKGSSLSMLLEATGLGKQSLYNCFGDKRALYLRAIEAAASRHAQLRARMHAAPTGRAALALYFEQLVAGVSGSAPEWRHCIVACGLLEQVDDEAVARRLGDKWAGTHEALREQVERGQKDGSIASALPSAALADLLLGVAGGLRLNANAGFDAARLRQTVGLALRALD
jgi:TetR/AcrR family transcriptional repressor of nem operon